jgi:hypothetical protein
MKNQPESNETQDIAREADQSRRKFTSAGVAGTGVLLSVASRSAMGGWGQCTGSELASGNLSRADDANPCGCSPGYWWNKNGSKSWDLYLASKYPKSSGFNAVFGVKYFKFNVPLQDCGPSQKHDVKFTGCSNTDTIAMHAVAALLNAEFFGNRYPVLGLQTAAGVISAFQSAFLSIDKCTALTAFKNRVDIYDPLSTWCFGSQHI